MLLEMRIDIKKDNLAMMKKIDKVSVNADTLQKEVRKLCNGQASMCSRIEVTEITQSEEKVHVNNILLDVNKLSDQIRVLQGIVQTQDQHHYLLNTERETRKVHEL